MFRSIGELPPAPLAPLGAVPGARIGRLGSRCADVSALVSLCIRDDISHAMPAHGTYEREQRTVTRLLAVGAMAEDWPKIKNRRTWRVFAVVR
jgi:hypothetical protein